MNRKLRFRLLWVISFMLVAPWTMAQKNIPPVGFAGEDYSEINPTENSYKTIDLGLNEVYENDDSYYEWNLTRAPEGYIPPSDGVFRLDNHSHWVQARVSVPGQYEFEVLRISKYGYQKECVTVTIKERVEIIDVECNRSCFSPGSTVEVSDFTFRTDPPDRQYLIEIANAEELASAMAWHGLSIRERLDVRFKCKKNSSDPNPVLSEKKCSILVVHQSPTISANFEIKTIYDNIKNIEKQSRVFNDYVQKFLKGFPVKWFWEISPILTMDESCCDYNIDNFVRFSLVGSLGVKWDVTVPVVPNAVYVPVYGKFWADVSFLDFVIAGSDIVNFYNTGEWNASDCSEAPSLVLNFVARLEGGIGIGFGEPHLFGVDVSVKAGGSVAAYWRITPFEMTFTPDGSGVYLVLEFQMRTLIGSFPIDFTLFQWPES